jgi:DNA repair photolyase
MEPYIISASRREDIPSFRTKWFLERLKEGKFLMNGFYKDYEISLNKTKLIVFWTKNPRPLMEHLDEIPYKYYFQYTLNYYPEYELNVPPLGERIQTFRDLSDKIGRDRVIWRFDPIIINDKISFKDIISKIEYIGNRVFQHTNKLVFSFVDPYQKLNNQFKEIDTKTKIEIASEITRLKSKWCWKFEIATCAEGIELEGIKHNKCVDPELIRKICGKQKWISDTKDKNQRLECGCIASGDVGTFKTCRARCQYCYAK